MDEAVAGMDGTAGRQDAAAMIAALSLLPHPEGGWYRETWRAPAADGARAAATAIYFLLERDRRSHWHRVDAAEVWLWHAGAPLHLATAPHDAGPVHEVLLGGDILAGEAAQAVVPPGHWQAARVAAGGTHAPAWTLVSCVVAPGFDFAGFTLAPPSWTPGG